MAEAVKKEDPKKKGIFSKIKESVDDKEEQLAYLATLIIVIVLIWTAVILTLNYVKIPGYDAGEKIDPTFIASVFTGTLATFGVQTGGKKKKPGDPDSSANISKKDMEFLIAKASETAPAQTIRIESGPVKIVPDTK